MATKGLEIVTLIVTPPLAKCLYLTQSSHRSTLKVGN
jgi:hypothetical protein